MTARTRLCLLFVAAVAFTLSCSPDGVTGPGESGNWQPGTATHSVTVGELPRTYLLHVPPKKRRGAGSTVLPFPLVIVMHGSSATSSDAQQMSQMDVVADSALFLVAYPQGSGGKFNIYASDWNAGTCCGGANRDKVDDLAFLTALIKEASGNVPIDAKHIYVAGFSAGGSMAYHAACQLPGTFAAFGVISGDLVDNKCAPAKPVPLWATHGTDDQEVAFDEPAALTPTGKVPTIAGALPPAVQFWITLQKCTGGAAKAASTHVSTTTMTGCVTSDVTFNAINGGTHGWPGGPVDPGNQPPMSELKASSTMWTFFSKHTRN